MGHPALAHPVRKEKTRIPMFCHSIIDDFDLSIEAFRVYSHLARKWGDGTFDSVGSYSKIGEHCFRASYPCSKKANLKRRAIAAIQELEEKELIVVHRHYGYDGRNLSNSYTLRTADELSNVIPFPNPSVQSQPSVNCHPPIEGTTSKESTSKGSHTKSAGAEKSENPKSEKISKEDKDKMDSPNNQPQPTSPLTTNELEKAKNSEDVDQKNNPDPYWTGHNEKVIDIQRKRAFRDSIGNAPFESVEEMNAFQKDLIEFAKLTGKRSPGGFAQSILKEMRESGFEHPYWLEWKHGEAIGTHEKQEWESLPGQPYPYFLEFLKEELKAQKHSDTQALQQANWIVSNPAHCKPHWEKFKLRIEREAEDKAKATERGVQDYVAPTWARSRFVSVEDAAKSMAQLEGQVEPQKQEKLIDEPQGEKDLPAKNQQETTQREEGWEDPVGIVEQWLDDIETKWSRPFRGLAQRCFADAIAHSTPDEEAEIYKMLLDCPTTREWAKQSVNEKVDFDF